jgi:hypothetical protein
VAKVVGCATFTELGQWKCFSSRSTRWRNASLPLQNWYETAFWCTPAVWFLREILQHINEITFITGALEAIDEDTHDLHILRAVICAMPVVLNTHYSVDRWP